MIYRMPESITSFIRTAIKGGCMLKKKHLSLAALVVVFMVVFIVPAEASKRFIVISTGGTGGTYYPLGGVLA